ncbi:MAG: hypothetical protein AB7W59_01235 [Acidimicrobiia bacterium]
MLVEHARNVMGIADAVHAEYGVAGTEIVNQLSCSLSDAPMTVALTPGSRLRRLHGSATSIERATCQYGLNPEYASIASEGGLAVAARDASGEVRAVERADLPFFVATLYQPQLSSEAGRPHPLLSGFVRAACASK